MEGLGSRVLLARELSQGLFEGHPQLGDSAESFFAVFHRAALHRFRPRSPASFACRWCTDRTIRKPTCAANTGGRASRPSDRWMGVCRLSFQRALHRTRKCLRESPPTWGQRTARGPCTHPYPAGHPCGSIAGRTSRGAGRSRSFLCRLYSMFAAACFDRRHVVTRVGRKMAAREARA